MPPSANFNGAASNGASPAPILGPGIYVPTVAFFQPDESVDVATTASHATRLAKTGIAGIVTQGSNGEAVHLSREERKLINITTRQALDVAGYPSMSLIVGCGAQSTRETLQLCVDAYESGGQFVIVLPPAYYGSLLPTPLIIAHFREVADRSPLPVLIYNFPGACSGLDLSSDTILELAQHKNIVGVKLTCGNTGKLARVVAGTTGTGFSTFGGSVDFTLQALAVGGQGIVGGTANIAPRACVRVMQLAQEKGKEKEAKRLQAVVARGDWVAIQGGFVSVKAGLQEWYGYGGLPRLPCRLLEGEALRKQVAGFAELVAVERELEKAAAAARE